jgi:hypothetical protein
MKIIPILLISLCLVACSSIVVKQDFPQAPADIMTACPELVLAKDSDKLSDLLSTVTTNYKLYHDCENKNSLWIEWYKKQKSIYESH